MGVGTFRAPWTMAESPKGSDWYELAAALKGHATVRAHHQAE